MQRLPRQYRRLINLKFKVNFEYDVLAHLKQGRISVYQTPELFRGFLTAIIRTSTSFVRLRESFDTQCSGSTAVSTDSYQETRLIAFSPMTNMSSSMSSAGSIRHNSFDPDPRRGDSVRRPCVVNLRSNPPRVVPRLRL